MLGPIFLARRYASCKHTMGLIDSILLIDWCMPGTMLSTFHTLSRQFYYYPHYLGQINEHRSFRGLPTVAYVVISGAKGRVLNHSSALWQESLCWPTLCSYLQKGEKWCVGVDECGSLLRVTSLRLILREGKNMHVYGCLCGFWCVSKQAMWMASRPAVEHRVQTACCLFPGPHCPNTARARCILTQKSLPTKTAESTF